MPSDEIQDLRALVAELTRRVYRLEQALGVEASSKQVGEETPAAPPAAPTPAPTAAPPPTPRFRLPIPRRTTTPPNFISLGERPAEAETSLETKIGSQWFNRIGIVAVLIGVSYFLKYAFENNWIGPGGRVAIGLVAGIAVVGWSERFRARGHLIFSWSLKAVGIGTLYLSLWAGFQVYHLFSAGLAFAAMVLVTACTAILSLTQNAQVLAAYALIGGFVTPLLLSTGQNREIVLFSYVALLDIATVALIVFRPWTRLLVGAFAGTVVLYVGWYTEFYTRPQMNVTLAYATLFFVVFALAPMRACRPEGEAGRNVSITLVLVPLVNAAAYFLELYAMLEEVSRTALAWAAVALAALYLLLSRQVQRRSGDEETAKLLKLLYLALAVGFLTTAIPLKLEMHWITVGWVVEAAVLMWISFRAPSLFLRGLATAALALGIGRLLLFDNFHPAHLIANARFSTYLIAIAAVAWSVSLAQRDQDEELAATHRIAAAIGIVAINVLLLVALNFEVHDYFQREIEVLHRTPNRVLAWSDLRQLRIARDFGYSALWMAYGAAMMWIGFWRRSAFLRWQALILMAVTIVKVFVYDVSELDKGYRILSFVILGVLLLAVSFIYQRDWLRLSGRRGPGDQPKGTSAPA